MSTRRIKLYEAETTVCLLKDIKPSDALEHISKLIDSTFVDTEYEEMHHKKEYKPYTFSSLYKPEINQNYSAGKLYTFRIRAISEDLIRHFSQTLDKVRNDFFQGITARYWQVKPQMISKLYSITPALLKNDTGYWKNNLTFDEVITRLINNAYKKYEFFTEEKPDEALDVFTQINVQNTQPIATTYKGIQLLGDKFELEVATNNQAQEIAYILLGCGILENGARGSGYVNPKWL